MNHGHEFLASALQRFQSQKKLADRAIAQVSDAGFHHSLHAETNSIAVVMKHLAGNMRSRWTDFLTTDSEKKDRDREFRAESLARTELLADWKSGWDQLFFTISNLVPADLARTVTIRGTPLSVYEAIHRQLDHYGYHLGQIVLIARIVAGDGPWQNLSIPRGKSAEFNAANWEKGSATRSQNNTG